MRHICSVIGPIISYQSWDWTDPNISVLHSSPLSMVLEEISILQGAINSVLRQSIQLTLKRGRIKNNDTGLMAIFPHHLVSASSTFCALFATDKVLVVRGF